jgi:tRNA A37 methylthiotransferase MiaB
MKNQVPDAVKKERLHSLSALQDRIRAELLADFIKTHGDVDVLFENTVDGYAIGHAPNFMEVKVKCDCSLSGKIVNVKLTHSDDSYLYGEI